MITTPTVVAQEVCTSSTVRNVDTWYYFDHNQTNPLIPRGSFFPLNATSACRNTLGDGMRIHAFPSFDFLPSIRFSYDVANISNPSTDPGDCTLERAARVGLMPPYEGVGNLVTTAMHPISLTGVSWGDISCPWTMKNFKVSDAFLVSTCGAGDLLLSTNNPASRIKLFTTATLGTQIERMTILNNGNVGIGTYNPIGKLDVNVGTANYNLGKISFTSGATTADPTNQPQIRLYSPSGDPNCEEGRSTSYSWYIQSLRQYNPACFSGLDGLPTGAGYNTTLGALHFRAGYNPTLPGDLYSSNIGTEYSIARMSLLSNGNVGINREVPMVRFQVTNGSVLFDGEQGATPLKRVNTAGVITPEEIGAGTRLMWIPSKAAFRAGEVDGDQWNTTNIGDYSAAFGLNNRVIGMQSIAQGLDNEIKTDAWRSMILGESNTIIETNNSMLIGNSNNIYYGDNCLGVGEINNFKKITTSYDGLTFSQEEYGNSFISGFGNNVYAAKSAAIGESNTIHRTSHIYGGITSQATCMIALGKGNVVAGQGAIAFGTENSSTKKFTIAGGWRCEATDDFATALGKANIASAHGATSFGYHSQATGSYSGTFSFYGNASASESMVIGSGTSTSLLQNSTAASLKIGFQSTDAALFIKGGVTGSTNTTQVGIGISTLANMLDVSGKVVIGGGAAYAGSAFAPTDGLIVQGNTVIGGTAVSGANVLTITGSAIAIGGVWTTSDKNLKKDISSFTDGLATIKQITPVRYHYNGQLGTDSSKEQIGIIAQEMQKIAPYAVQSDTFTTRKVTKAAQYIETGEIDTTDDGGRKVLRYEPAEIQEEKNIFLIYNSAPLAYITINAVKELDANITLTNTHVQIIDSITQTVQQENKILLTDNIVLNQRIKAVEEDNILSKQKIKELEDKIQQIQTTCCKNVDLYEDVLLEQNVPNPFAKETIITYFVPERLTGRIELVVADASGNTILNSISVQTNIPSQYTYSANELNTGVYLYGIAINGQIIKSKKMIVIK